MRILPHVIVHGDTPDVNNLMNDIIKNGLITHGHPRALLGATCYAYALLVLLRREKILKFGELVNELIDHEQLWSIFPNYEKFSDWLKLANEKCGYNYRVEWRETRNRMLENLNYIRDSLRVGLVADDFEILNKLEAYGKANGAGDVAALSSIYLASKYANNPILGIKIPAFSKGIDTDTIASMTGGLLGMLNGTTWIPEEWQGVQDYHHIQRMAEILCADDRLNQALTDSNTAKQSKKEWRYSDIGYIRLLGETSILTGNKDNIIIKKWETALGQTIYEKSLRKGASNIMKQEPKAVQLDFKFSLDESLQPKEAEPTISKDRHLEPEDVATSQIFSLNVHHIKLLLGSKSFQNKITIGKALKVIEVLLSSNKSDEEIAKAFGIQKEMVFMLRQYIR